MIRATLDWIEKVNKEYDLHPTRVLDVGSFDYNGNPRHLFPDSDYTGIDIKAGPSVDKIFYAEQMSAFFDKGEFDAVLCLYVLEHVPNIWRVLGQVRKVLKRGGHFYIAVPTLGFPRHDSPGDYWRPTEQAVRGVIMHAYEILSLEHGKTRFGKHPIIHCLGIRG